MTAPRPIGYIALLRNNKPFRRLWYGQVVSQLGDWFDSIALFTLLLNLTGSGQAVGLLLVAEYLPATLISPFAGVLIDRLPRKLVMVLSDIGRALLVLALLLVRDPGDVWLIYVVAMLKVMLTAFFEPARSAIIPSLARREELVVANSLSGATWSVMLAIGAALGGLVAGTLGVQTAFLLDAGSFLLSAVLIASIPFREQRDAVPAEGQAGGGWRVALGAGWRELGDGLRFIGQQRDVFWYTITKGLWSVGGGILLLLTLYGREIFPVGLDGAISIGLLYAARGLGAGIGPLVARRIGGEGVGFLRRAIGMGVILTGLGYLMLSGAPSLVVGMLAVLLAHMGGSTQWVFSSALLQLSVPNRLRGRVFAVEYATQTFATALSSYVTGLASDAGMAPRVLTVWLALVFFLNGVVLLLALWKQRPIPVEGQPTAPG